MSTDGSATSRSLLQGLKAHDAPSWEKMARLYAPLVHFWSRRAGVAEQDIADVVQDVFRGVVAGIARFRKEQASDTFRGWLRTITRNSLADHFRKHSRSPAAVGGSDARQRIERIEFEQDPCDDEDRAAEQALLLRGLETIRSQFDPRTWQAFWRVVVDGRSAAEVAVELGMQPGTVRVAKSRVLQRLRRELGDVD